MRIVGLCGILAVSVLLSACATITRGASETFRIQSSPDAANVQLSTGQSCVTPCQLHLKRKHDFTATFSKPGYATKTENIEARVRAGGIVAGAGNILIGGIPGAVVDAVNGSLNDLRPNPLVVTLEPEAAAAETSDYAAAQAVDAGGTASAAAMESSTAAPLSAGEQYVRLCYGKEGGASRPLFCPSAGPESKAARNARSQR